MAANVTIVGANQIQITTDDDTTPDWSYVVDVLNKALMTSPLIKLAGYFFDPSAAGDGMALRDGSATGIILGVPISCDSANDQRYVDLRGIGYVKPYIDKDDCTFDTPGSVTITLVLEG